MPLSLAVIARDSAALTASRAQLAHLLHQLEALRSEAEPLHEQLARLDQAAARHDQALAHRDALLQSFEALIAESIALGAPRPEVPPALEDAEIALRQAASDERAIVSLRDQLQIQISSLNERTAPLQAALREVIGDVILEEALRLAGDWHRAIAAADPLDAVVSGVFEHLRIAGLSNHRERLDKRLRAMQAAREQSPPNISAVARLAHALMTDPSAELEVE
jgi:hypothetical protein